ncbi:MAG: hypothetical protein H7256_14085 [Bdellovibrio sp.]|nr:hypothetical protein [Bdellovibrio sp.]
MIQSFGFLDRDLNRAPAAASDWTQVDFDHATAAVSLSEFQNSKPTVGRSYFDMIFSKKDASGMTYDIPYPFNKIIAKLEDYNGQKVSLSDSSGPKVVIFPMGRSLQRNAAVAGLNQAFSFDPYFRFPRVVVGIDEEPKYDNAVLLNLKNKFYIGFNERAEILEVISYNEESGRFEYQLVHDYASGKAPKASYANRSLCLSCHQNQTPIFSRGPWSESNANPQMSDELKKKLDASFGLITCGPNNDQSYCYKDGKFPQYFGAPIKIDQSISYKFDTSTDEANLTHAYQKGWKELCSDPACRLSLLEAILLYRFSSFDGIIPDTGMKMMLLQIDQNWKAKYPGGLSIASPNIPNRDPMKDIATPSTVSAGSLSTVKSLDQQTVQQLLTQSRIPTEFEPLLPRKPLDIWKDSGFDSHQTNRLLKGLANEFTLTDIKMFDQWLAKNKSPDQVIAEVTSQCQIDQVGKDVALTCAGPATDGFSFDAYIPNSTMGQVSQLSITTSKLNCDPVATQMDQNRYSGKSCPQFTDLNVTFTKINPNTAVLVFHRPGGLNLRTLHGFYIAEATVDLTTKQARLKIYNQSQVIKSVLSQTQKELFKTETFSRFQIMTTLMKFAQVQGMRLQNGDMTGLEMRVEGDVSVNDLTSSMSGFDIMKNTCAKCHQNNEGVPPNFMGLPIVKTTDYDQCRRIEQCAPRLIYRLKMRNCNQTDFQKKKNPMPPDFFLQNIHMPKDIWMKGYAAKVLTYLMSLISEADVAKVLTSHGMAANDAMVAAQDILRSECPNSNSVIYDQLPKCEFNEFKNLTRCH